MKATHKSSIALTLAAALASAAHGITIEVEQTDSLKREYLA